MEPMYPKFMMLGLAVGAGLLAVFVVWVSKQIANEKTRSQGITAAAIAGGLLLVGLMVIPTRTVVHMAPATRKARTLAGTTRAAVGARGCAWRQDSTRRTTRRQRVRWP